MGTVMPHFAVIYCLSCEYPLLGLREPRCPECGRLFDPDNPATYSRGDRLTRGDRLINMLTILSVLLLVGMSWLAGVFVVAGAH